MCFEQDPGRLVKIEIKVKKIPIHSSLMIQIKKHSVVAAKNALSDISVPVTKHITLVMCCGQPSKD